MAMVSYSEHSQINEQELKIHKVWIYTKYIGTLLKGWVKFVGQLMVGQEIAQCWGNFTQLCLRSFNQFVSHNFTQLLDIFLPITLGKKC